MTTPLHLELVFVIAYGPHCWFLAQVYIIPYQLLVATSWDYEGLFARGYHFLLVSKFIGLMVMVIF